MHRGGCSQGSYGSRPSFSRTLRLASTSAASASACAASKRCRRVAYSGSVSQWVASAFKAASSLTSDERSRAVSLATSLGSCGPIYGCLFLCQKSVEQAPAILFLVRVYPHDQRRLPSLHRLVSDSRYVQDFGAGMAAHGFQILEHFFRDPDRLLLAHPPNILRHPRNCPASLRLSIASSRTASSSAMPTVYGQPASWDHPITSPSPASTQTGSS